MIFADSDIAMHGFVVFRIITFWSLWFFVLRVKPEEKSK